MAVASARRGNAGGGWIGRGPGDSAGYSDPEFPQGLAEAAARSTVGVFAPSGDVQDLD